MNETVENVLSKIKDFCNNPMENADALSDACEEYSNNDEEYNREHAVQMVETALDNIYSVDLGEYYYYLMTFLLHVTGSVEVYKRLISHLIDDISISKESKFFLYNQLMRYNFLNPGVMDEELSDLYDNLYRCIYREYSKEFENEYTFIRREDRNHDFVMVYITQVLEMGHGPTKTLLDRCYILQKYLNKKVFIVNTAEFVNEYGSIPCFHPVCANYNDEYNEVSSILYKDCEFDFFQCPREMPDVRVVREILNIVSGEKPYFILTIGGNSIVNDMCSMIVPTISIATVPSTRTTTYGQFQAIGRKVNEQDLKWMTKHSLPYDHIIESLFTSAFKQQTHHYTRKEIGLPEDRFIAIIIGGRLDEEIDAEFMKLLDSLTDRGIYIAFAGVFEKYKGYAEQKEAFKNNSIYLGFQDDMLAVNECCDLYINPKRLGGGTSVAEALYKGLPVVTLDYGDVGLGAGKIFCVSDYDEMYEQVIKYSEDSKFYSEMSQKARERAAQLMDSKQEFAKIIHKAEESERF